MVLDRQTRAEWKHSAKPATEKIEVNSEVEIGARKGSGGKEGDYQDQECGGCRGEVLSKESVILQTSVRGVEHGLPRPKQNNEMKPLRRRNCQANPGYRPILNPAVCH